MDGKLWSYKEDDSDILITETRQTKVGKWSDASPPATLEISMSSSSIITANKIGKKKAKDHKKTKFEKVGTERKADTVSSSRVPAKSERGLKPKPSVRPTSKKASSPAPSEEEAPAAAPGAPDQAPGVGGTERTSTRFLSTDQGSQDPGPLPETPPEVVSSDTAAKPRKTSVTQKKSTNLYVCIGIVLVVVMGIILYFAIFARGKKTETITTRSFTTPKSATGPNLMLIRKRLKRSLKVADNLKSRIQQCPSTMSRHDRLSFVMRANLSHLRMAFVDPTYRMLFKVAALVSFPYDVIKSNIFKGAYVAIVLNRLQSNMTFFYFLLNCKNQEPVRIQPVTMGTIAGVRQHIQELAENSRRVDWFKCTRGSLVDESINVTQFQVKAEIDLTFSRLLMETCNPETGVCSTTYNQSVPLYEFKTQPEFRMSAITGWTGLKYPKFDFLHFANITTSCEIHTSSL